MTLPALIKNPKMMVPPKRLRVLFLLMVLLTIFAVTNKIGIGNYEVIIPVPWVIIDQLNIFRSSGRFFWPVYYAILLSAVIVLVKGYGTKVASAILAATLLIQVVDTSSGWLNKKSMLADNAAHWQTPFKSEFWEYVPERYSKIRVILPVNTSPNWFPIAYFSATNGMGTDAVYLAKRDSDKLEMAREKAEAAIITGNYEKDSLYVISDEYLDIVSSNINEQKDLLTKIDNVYVVAPDWFSCGKCPGVKPLY